MPPNNSRVTQPTTSSIKAITTPAGLGIQVDDVSKSLWQYVKKHKLKEVLLFITLTVAWEALVVFIFALAVQSKTNDSSNSGQGFGYLLFLPIFLGSSWFYKLRKQFEDAFLEEFALENNYSFDKNGAVDKTYGTIFRLGGTQTVSDILTGSYEGNIMRLFLYETVIRQGRSSKRLPYTVMELDLNGSLPDLLMLNTKHSNIAAMFGTKHTISLEGDFNKYFTLYGMPGNEVEALEVFSPDTMALMEDESRHYTVEFAANKIYIYAKGFVGDAQNITQFFQLAKQLIAKIGPLANRLQNDSAIIPAPINLMRPRSTNLATKKVVTLAIFSVAFIGLGGTAATILSHSHIDKTDLGAAEKVSNQFMQDLQQSDARSAYRLEAPDYQAIRDQQPELVVPIAYVPTSGQVLYDAAIDSYSFPPTAGVVYKFNDTGGGHYVEIWLERNNGIWQVFGFNATNTPIQATT